MRVIIPVLLTLILAAATATAHAFDIGAKQAFLLDDTSGSVLAARAADEKMYPSSMSKLMTLYLLFEKLKQGGITLDDTFPVSEKAWRKGGSKMFVRVNTEVRVEDLIRGIIVHSGNDACIVVAEALGGSEAGFAKQMNEKADALGLTGSHFTNSTGWPDENHYMTARDLALLSQRLIRDFPEYYPYFAEQTYTYNNITQPNRNRLLGKGLGVDGLKTGHTEAAGYGIAVSARPAEGTRRLIAVVNGLPDDEARHAEARRLLEHGFRDFELLELKAPGEPVASLPVWLGEREAVSLSVSEPLLASLPRDRDGLSFRLKSVAPVKAPIRAGEELALLEIRDNGRLMQSQVLVAAEDVAEAGFLSRFFSKAALVLGL